jgi:hypothetical protein
VPLYIYGTTPAFLDVRTCDLAEGVPFTDRDVHNRARVCLLGQVLVNELFQGAPPLGKEVRLNNVPFQVIGVLGRKGPNLMGLEQDDILLAPWTAIKDRVEAPSLAPVTTELYPTNEPGASPPRFTTIDQILARARSEDEVPEAVRQVTELLQERHHIKPGEADDFNIRDMGEMARALASTEKQARQLRTWMWLRCRCHRPGRWRSYLSTLSRQGSCPENTLTSVTDSSPCFPVRHFFNLLSAFSRRPRSSLSSGLCAHKIRR